MESGNKKKPFFRRDVTGETDEAVVDAIYHLVKSAKKTGKTKSSQWTAKVRRCET